MRKKLNEIYKNDRDGWKAYKLLSYIFATNRSTIRKLLNEDKVSFPKELAFDEQGLD